MSILTDASLIITPNAYKAGSLLAVVPSNGNGDLTWTRNGGATRVNSAGLTENVLANVPRLDYSLGSCPNILLEPQRTNILLNSETLVTQSLSTTGLACAVSFYGTGTITFSGTFTGTLVGTGANNRVSTVFTPTTGTLTLTVSGSVTKAQLEQGAYPTSYIPTTSATVTRVADVASKTGISSLINSEEGTLFINQKYLSNLGVKRFGLFGTSIDDRIVFSTSDNTSNVAIFIFINGVNKYAYTYISSDILDWHKFALKWKNGEVKLFVNGLLLNTSLTFTTFPANTLNNIALNSGGTNNFEGNIKSIQVYKTALTDTQLAQLTTL